MTHDAKRAEDVRARINVLSELPEEWERCLNNWSGWNEGKCKMVKGIRAPERNEETLLYQTLLGSWPTEEPVCACYTKRIQEFMVKAVREAMVHTRWTVPNIDHEKALVDFVAAILHDSPDNRFLHDFKSFAAKIAFHGALNSLSQLLLKLVSPGVADFYQGTELWDLRLVDPDNRGSIDFKRREEILSEIRDNSFPAQLISGWQDGRIKMHVTRCGLQFRRNRPSLFLRGDYIPLDVDGERRDCVIAVARRYRSEWCVAVAPRFTTRLIPDRDKFRWDWLDTRIVLPKEAPLRWESILAPSGSDETARSERTLMVGDLLREFPIAMISSV
jgi:(1->4)-alpha-D-glucan 1-alpha-D-glucosylmutase